MIRTLTLNGQEFDVDSSEGILFSSSSKFSGMRPHAVVENDSSLASESFGDVEGRGFFWAIRKNGAAWSRGPEENPNGSRYYVENEQGFVYEISAEGFLSEARADQEDAEREEALENAQEAEQEAEAEASKDGPCDNCAVLYINGVRCHEEGCPTATAYRDAIRLVARLSDGV